MKLSSWTTKSRSPEAQGVRSQEACQRKRTEDRLPRFLIQSYSCNCYAKSRHSTEFVMLPRQDAGSSWITPVAAADFMTHFLLCFVMLFLLFCIYKRQGGCCEISIRWRKWSSVEIITLLNWVMGWRCELEPRTSLLLDSIKYSRSV